MVTLTDRGRRAVDSFRERRNMIVNGALSQLSEEDREEAVLALAKIVKALEEYGAEKATQDRMAQLEDESRTADQSVMASNIISRARQGHGSGKMKIEWD
jgi:hypothetical protein